MIYPGGRPSMYLLVAWKLGFLGYFYFFCCCCFWSGGARERLLYDVASCRFSFSLLPPTAFVFVFMGRFPPPSLLLVFSSKYLPWAMHAWPASGSAFRLGGEKSDGGVGDWGFRYHAEEPTT